MRTTIYINGKGLNIAMQQRTLARILEGKWGERKPGQAWLLLACGCVCSGEVLWCSGLGCGDVLRWDWVAAQVNPRGSFVRYTGCLPRVSTP